MTMNDKSGILELRVFVHQQTDRAILVSEDNDPKSAFWLPISQIECAPAPSEIGQRRVDLQIPQWLAEDKRLA